MLRALIEVAEQYYDCAAKHRALVEAVQTEKSPGASGAKTTSGEGN